MSRKCPECQADVFEGSDFCSRCGCDLSASPRASAPSVPSPVPAGPVSIDVPSFGGLAAMAPGFSSTPGSSFSSPIGVRPVSGASKVPVAPEIVVQGDSGPRKISIPLQVEVEAEAPCLGTGCIRFHLANLSTDETFKGLLGGSVSEVGSGDFELRFKLAPGQRTTLSDQFKVEQPGAKLLKYFHVFLVMSSAGRHQPVQALLKSDRRFEFMVRDCASSAQTSFNLNNLNLSHAAEIRFNVDTGSKSTGNGDQPSRTFLHLVPTDPDARTKNIGVRNFHEVARPGVVSSAGCHQDRMMMDIQAGGHTRRLFVYTNAPVLFGRQSGASPDGIQTNQAADVVLRFVDRLPGDVEKRKFLQSCLPRNACSLGGSNTASTNFAVWKGEAIGPSTGGTNGGGKKARPFWKIAGTDDRFLELAVQEISAASEDPILIDDFQPVASFDGIGATSRGPNAGALVTRRGDLPEHAYLMLFRQVDLRTIQELGWLQGIDQDIGLVLVNYNHRVWFSATGEHLWTLNDEPMLRGELFQARPGDHLSCNGCDIRVHAVVPERFVEAPGTISD